MGQQLLAFIRSQFGAGCEIKSKNPSSHAGTLDVVIAGDEGDDVAEHSQCPLNFSYAVKYSPSKNVAVLWKIGQDGRFDDLDQEMVSSFQFDGDIDH